MATDAVSNDPFHVLPVELHPVVDHLVTEDDTPVDSVFSEKQMRLLTEPLYSSWICPAGEQSFVAMANVGFFFDLHRPPLVPDVLLSTNVVRPKDFRPKKFHSYFIWEYGKPPDVVVEVVSNREGGESTKKLDAYAEVRVTDYVIFDPDRLLSPELLRVYRLMGGDYCKMDKPIWFPKVGLGLQLWQGEYEGWDNTWLRWVDLDGILIPTGYERGDAGEQAAESERERADAERRRAEAEHQRAEAEHQRADTERQRAETERQRADRLAEQLRQLGIEPSNP